MTHDDTGILPMPDLASTFPGPFPVSPHADDIEEHTRAWLQEFPLPAEADTLRVLCNIAGQGVARTMPTADLDSLVLCTELFVWLTLFDDVHGEVAAMRDPGQLDERVEELGHVLNDPAGPAPGSPFAAALQDLLGRLHDRATPSQYERLTDHLLRNLVAIAQEAWQSITPEGLTVAGYCAMRPDTVFVRTLIITVEILLGYQLTAKLRTSRSVRALEKAVGNLAGWINDLASYEREAAQLRAAPLSLPTLLMTECGIRLPDAFQLASQMCEEQANIARARMTELSAGGLPPLVRHAQALEHITHSFIWHIDHARYRP
ncbi:terpene synthase family protein [Streptomyces sp. NPDC090493]|uniref:terpene synthase family protein n=1 Tax=Streptomyces sp. NPDC090493 TaxID=3365964 RepID=UPI0038078DF7